MSYFGIDSNAIGFSTTDYVTKGISLVYAPILVLLIGWAALLWAGACTRRLAREGRRTGVIRGVG